MNTLPAQLDRASVQLVDDALGTTRAIRRRLDPARPVNVELLEDALEVAGQAPSGGAEQPVRWIVVTDERARRRVGEAYRAAYTEFDQERDAPGNDAGGTIGRVRSSSAHLAQTMTDVPAIVVVCSAAERPVEPTGPSAAKFYASVYPAVWSLQIALRARGLGSCITTIGLRHRQTIAEVLDVPAGWTQCALLPVAHINGESLRPAARRPVEEVTRWI